MRAPLSSLFLLMTCTAVAAQTTAPATPAPAVDRKIQRIVVEDGGSRVDELRLGGETQSIRVQPKAGVPAYEITPTDGARSRPATRDEQALPGQRVWNILSF